MNFEKYFLKDKKNYTNKQETGESVVLNNILKKDSKTNSVNILSENNISHIDRLVCPNDIKEDVAIELIKRSIEAGERMPNEEEKSLENIGLINTANEIANKYAKFYGVDKPFDIPLENIHILSHYSDKTEGDWIAEDCMITVKERHDDTKIDLARKLFHELIHSKSYNVIKSELKDGKLNLINYGSGIGINLKRKDGRGYQDNNFFSLNEAITEMLTERFYNECKNNGIFSSEEVLD
ncbi:hypothetical protein EOL72_01800, partial [Candidatus Falkowbacteria bacterium]|nr:hypothetical protein [Candidatus Falkowbacteria bacterium]